MKERLDKLLFDKKLVSSRSQAKSLIEKGDVIVAGKIIKKASEMFDLDAHIEIQAPLYVGRGAFKLEKAFAEFKVQAKDKICMDIGASTGGFTEVLLLHGAKKVFSIDVGSGQLAQKLREDNRVINLENTNIKDLNSLPEKISLAVMDLSFISIVKVLNSINLLLDDGGELVALIKPQFEIGRENLPKDGVVKDENDRLKTLHHVLDYAKENGWKVLSWIESPIEGKSGNKEYLAFLKKL